VFYGVLLIAAVMSWLMGGAARLLVPGPDPMPLAHQLGIGFVGAVVGAFAVAGIAGGEIGDHAFAPFLTGVGVSVLLVLGHRRYVRHVAVLEPFRPKRPQFFGRRQQQS
jgi:uncharacterized membrane protein YeaQ/YmgE (transglycosylase-associated protein family)